MVIAYVNSQGLEKKNYNIIGSHLKRKAKKKVITGIALNAALATVSEVYFKPMWYTFNPTVILGNKKIENN